MPTKTAAPAKSAKPKKTAEMVSIALRLPRELLSRLDAEVIAQNSDGNVWPKITRTDLIRRCIAAKL